MGKKLSKLIDVKSIVTFLLTGGFIYLGITQAVKPDQYLTIYTMIISFYFGTQVGKKEPKEDDDEKEGKA
jgi:hypothetical protein